MESKSVAKKVYWNHKPQLHLPAISFTATQDVVPFIASFRCDRNIVTYKYMNTD